MSKPKSQLNRTILASDISDLLNLPRGAHGMCPLGRKIVDTILTSICDALHRGEEVYIKDFGRFWVQSGYRKVIKPALTWGVYSPVFVEFKSRNKVRFTPARMIQYDNKRT